MWKLRKDDESPSVPQPPAAAPVREPIPAPREVHPEPARPIRAEMARIGKSIKIKGRLSGGEDLFVDGEVEGSIDVSGHLLTVGPNGHVRANIQAPNIVIFGRVQGNLRGGERVELRKSAVVSGDILSQRVMIEEGAFLQGGVAIQKAVAKPEAPRDFAEPAVSPIPATTAPSQPTNAGSQTAVPKQQ